MTTNECTYIARGLGRKVRGQVEREAMVRHPEGYRARAARDDLDVVRSGGGTIWSDKSGGDGGGGDGGGGGGGGTGGGVTFNGAHDLLELVNRHSNVMGGGCGRRPHTGQCQVNDLGS